tara:strand:- start:5 stop:1531 length:1527 start_codon:yes stop_codon:yes gene_type:complete
MTSLNDLTDYDTPLQPNSIDIRTEYLEPISKSTYKYTFRLDQSGYLDTNSMLCFKFLATGAALDNKCRTNIWNGALGGIKRVIFQVGDNIINDVQDVYKYATLKNMNMPPSMRNGFLGHYLGNQLHLETQKTSDQAPIDNQLDYNVCNSSTVGAINVNHGMSGISMGTNDGNPDANINSCAISTNADNNHQWGITLGTLLPALKGQKIPLFVFDKQRILLTFEFNTSDIYCNNISDANVAYAAKNGVAGKTDVIPTEVKLVVDYLVMPSDVQNQVLEQTRKQGGYRLEFYDVVNVEKNIQQAVNGQEQVVEHRIGQNNREVHNILMWKEVAGSSMNAATANQQGTLAASQRGQALMCGQGQKCQGYSKEEFNCNIDGRDEFDHMVYSPLSQYNELNNVLTSDLQVCRSMYDCSDNTAQSSLSTLESGLLGVMKPLGLSLRNGEPVVVGGGRQIGNYPIVWKWRRQGHSAPVSNCPRDDHSIKCNYFIEVSRVANILNTGNGMSVVVSY